MQPLLHSGSSYTIGCRAAHAATPRAACTAATCRCGCRAATAAQGSTNTALASCSRRLFSAARALAPAQELPKAKRAHACSYSQHYSQRRDLWLGRASRASCQRLAAVRVATAARAKVPRRAGQLLRRGGAVAAGGARMRRAGGVGRAVVAAYLILPRLQALQQRPLISYHHQLPRLQQLWVRACQRRRGAALAETTSRAGLLQL